MKKKVTIGPGRDTSKLWMLRKRSRMTDGGPRLCGLVVGDVHRRGAQTVSAIYPLPSDDQLRVRYDRVCSHGYCVCAKCDKPIDYGARHMVPNPVRNAYVCGACSWRSGTSHASDSQNRFYAHFCADWPEGMVGIQMCCAQHGESEMFATQAKSDAWMDSHSGCTEDAEVRASAAPFKVDDPVKWRTPSGDERTGVIEDILAYGACFVKADDRHGRSFVKICDMAHDVAQHLETVHKTPAVGPNVRKDAVLFEVGDRVRASVAAHGKRLGDGEIVAVEKHGADVKWDEYETPGYWSLTSLEHVR